VFFDLSDLIQLVEDLGYLLTPFCILEIANVIKEIPLALMALMGCSSSDVG
jgi:hypothetical protein